MESRAAVKVGLVAIAGISLFLVGWWYLSHLSLGSWRLYATFNNTKGLQEQTPVRMNGVTVGEVGSVVLQPGSLKPTVTLVMAKSFQDRIPTDSSIRITSGLLITNPQVEIVPGSSGVMFVDGDRFTNVEAEPASGLAQISPEADQALKHLSGTIGTLTPRLNGTMDKLDKILTTTNQTMENVRSITGSTAEIVSNKELKVTLHTVMTDLRSVASDARKTASVMSVEIQDVVKRSGGKLDQLTNGLLDLLNKYADVADAARSAVARLTEQVGDPRLQQSIQETLDLAKTTLARFNQIASDIHQLTGDPNVQNDLKTTVATLRETTANGQQLVEKVNSIVSRIPVPNGQTKFGIGRPSLSIDFVTRTNAPHFRSDVGIRIPIGAKNAAHLGLRDFAESYKLNAQYETALSRFSDLRYGIYGAKLGVGFDWAMSPSTSFTVDAYNPNDFRLDARAQIRLNDDFSLLLGADSIMKSTTPFIGVRLER